MFDRRSSFRKPIRMFFNKYLGGYPHLCRSVDLSSTGLLAVTYSEPEVAMDSFPISLRLPGDPSPVWVWARGVWRQDRTQAIEFLSSGSDDAHRLERFLAVQAA
jgi:hypothetical protein